MTKRLLLQIAGFFFLTSVFPFAPAALAVDQWQISTLHSFGNADRSAQQPISGIILGRDGKLYGTFLYRGPGGGGAVFRLNRDGSAYQVIHAFSNQPLDLGGNSPFAGVVQASDGRLYGTTLSGGTNFGGTIYSLNSDGTDFRVILHFGHQLGDAAAPGPDGELIEGADGMLYGTTVQGGSLGNGSVFRLNKDGSGYQVLHEFDETDGQGSFPEAPVLQGKDGALYGTTADNQGQGPGKVFKLNTDGSGFQILHDFGANTNDGSLLLWGLMEGRDGAIYGTTFYGGTRDGGTVFKLRKDGSHYQVLMNFGTGAGQPSRPFSPLREGPDGRVYGFVQNGGGGMLFGLDENGGSFQVKDSFGLRARDVQHPLGALAIDAAGNIYGASYSGGLADNGTLFCCMTKGGHRVLRSLNWAGGDGSGPNCKIAVGANGILYGATQEGGYFGQGTVYEMNPQKGYKVLLNLSDPPTGLALDASAGDIYLTTGGYRNNGFLYRVSAKGKMKVLHRFRGGNKDGASPGAPLLASDGFLYGLTAAGGTNVGGGVIYRIGEDGKHYQILHTLNGTLSFTAAALIEGSDGFLYGSYRPLGPAAPLAVFKMAKDGSGFAVLQSFNTGYSFMIASRSLIEGSDGFIYVVVDNTYLLGLIDIQLIQKSEQAR